MQTTRYTWMAEGERVIAEFGRARMSVSVGMLEALSKSAGAAQGSQKMGGMFRSFNPVMGGAGIGRGVAVGSGGTGSATGTTMSSSEADVQADRIFVTDKRMVLAKEDGTIAFEAARDIDYARKRVSELKSSDDAAHVAYGKMSWGKMMRGAAAGVKQEGLYIVQGVEGDKGGITINFQHILPGYLSALARAPKSGFAAMAFRATEKVLDATLMKKVKYGLELKDEAGRAAELLAAMSGSGNAAELSSYSSDKAQLLNDYLRTA